MPDIHLPSRDASSPHDACYHGGAFFDAIGDEFDALARRHDVISADVLDAWFDPAPRVIDALAAHLAWALRTSPPTSGDGMRRVIARARRVDADSVLPGAGSSDLIFLALREWLHHDSRVLMLDPTYGEYAHVLERVISCQVDRLTLDRARGWAVDPDELSRRTEQGYDWVVLVNPNSPTGQHVPREILEAVMSRAPAHTRFWIDETYVEYAGAGQSLELFAARSPNVVICKSMSKMYALSGVRAGYLCGPAALMRELRAVAPPWSVSLPAQIAACEALRSVGYYRERWRETHALRAALAAELRTLEWDVVSGCANFLLCHLPATQPDAAALVAACRTRNLFLRDVREMGRCFDDRMVRVTVKDAETNRRMMDILRAVLAELAGAPAVAVSRYG
ncbi:MAG: pyridoxal phosphate-dependent aminotransferase [Gemmatimonadaceae bacterium]